MHFITLHSEIPSGAMALPCCDGSADVVALFKMEQSILMLKKQVHRSLEFASHSGHPLLSCEHQCPQELRKQLQLAQHAAQSSSI